MKPSFATVAQATHRWVRWFAATPAGAWLFARVLHRVDRIAFRLTGGRRTVTSVLSGLPVVMLTTTGARTGLSRTVPVLGIPVGAGVAVAAGNFGSPRAPGWCLNLRADPHAQIVRGGRLCHLVAEELTGAAWEEVWRIGLEVYPGAAFYARKAGKRTIAVFLLNPDPAGG